MEIFGKEIAVKSHGCNVMDEPGQRIIPSVKLFVKVTKGCNAHCRFCCNANSTDASSVFSIPKLINVIKELKGKGICVNRINITGGEPSVVSPLVYKILDAVEENSFDDVHLHLNTNGLLPQSQEMMRHPRWDSISMSIHHYDVSKLSELYGCRIPEKAFDFEGIDLQKVNSSCNLVKGYIDNAEEAHKMLDFNLEDADNFYSPKQAAYKCTFSYDFKYWPRGKRGTSFRTKGCRAARFFFSREDDLWVLYGWKDLGECDAPPAENLL